MSSPFYDDYDNRLLPGATENTEENEEKTDTEVQEEAATEEYYALPPTLKSRSLIWSMVSFVAGILSILLCPFYYVSLVFAAGSVATSLVSRKNLGFFEKYAIFGLILGMMGIVFGVSSSIAIRLGIF